MKKYFGKLAKIFCHLLETKGTMDYTPMNFMQVTPQVCPTCGRCPTCGAVHPKPATWTITTTTPTTTTNG